MANKRGKKMTSQFPSGAKQPIPTRPPMSIDPRQISPDQIETLTKLAGMLKTMKPDYMPITKCLEMIGIEPKTMTVMIGDDPVDCLVIPLQELMAKEWLKMSGRASQPPGEAAE